MRTRLPAAIAAPVLGLLLLAGCADEAGPTEGNEDTENTASATPTPPEPPTPTPTSAASEEPAGATALTTKDLGQGPPPAVDLLSSTDPGQVPGTWSLTRPSGEVVTLAGTAQLFGFAPFGNDLVVLESSTADGATAAVLVDAEGREVTRQDSLGYRLAVSTNGRFVAFVAPDGSVRGWEQASGEFELPAVDGATEIGGIVGQDTCSEVESDVGGCTAYVNVADPQQARITSSHGITDLAGTMLSVADAAGDGRVLGLVSVGDQGSCSGLYVERMDPTWQTCDHTLTSFSPGGRSILGTDAYLDGFGQRSVVFLDRDGAVLHEFTSKGRGPTILQTAWEDEEHVLAVVHERGRWSVVRLGRDGSAEIAVGPVEGRDLDRPFFLPSQ